MASSRSSNSSSRSESSKPGIGPALVPQGQHKGKPGMTLSRPFTLAGGRNRAHLHLVSNTVSKVHAAIVKDGPRVYVRDLASRTHVYVNGRIIREMELSNGDLLQIGSFTFKLLIPPSRETVVTPPPGQLELLDSQQVLPLDGGRTTTIGKRATCDLVVDDESVSTVHAIIYELDGLRYIRDLGSRTGTFVNGTAIHQQPLNFGDRVRVGTAEYRYAESDGHGAFDDMSELEDLVGTARLGLGHEDSQGLANIAPGAEHHTVTEPGIPADEGISTIGEAPAEAAEDRTADAPIPLALDDDDLIPLAGSTPKHAAPPPQAPSIEEDDFAPLGLASDAPAAPPAEPAAPQPPAKPERIDLDAELQATDLSDTASLPPPRPAPKMPTISPLVQDYGAEEGANGEAAEEPPADPSGLTQIEPVDWTEESGEADLAATNLDALDLDSLQPPAEPPVAEVTSIEPPLAEPTPPPPHPVAETSHEAAVPEAAPQAEQDFDFDFDLDAEAETPAASQTASVPAPAAEGESTVDFDDLLLELPTEALPTEQAAADAIRTDEHTAAPTEAAPVEAAPAELATPETHVEPDIAPGEPETLHTASEIAHTAAPLAEESAPPEMPDFDDLGMSSNLIGLTTHGRAGADAMHADAGRDEAAAPAHADDGQSHTEVAQAASPLQEWLDSRPAEEEALAAEEVTAADAGVTEAAAEPGSGLDFLDESGQAKAEAPHAQEPTPTQHDHYEEAAEATATPSDTDAFDALMSEHTESAAVAAPSAPQPPAVTPPAVTPPPAIAPPAAAAIAPSAAPKRSLWGRLFGRGKAEAPAAAAPAAAVPAAVIPPTAIAASAPAPAMPPSIPASQPLAAAPPPVEPLAPAAAASASEPQWDDLDAELAAPTSEQPADLDLGELDLEPSSEQEVAPEVGAEELPAEELPVEELPVEEPLAEELPAEELPAEPPSTDAAPQGYQSTGEPRDDEQFIGRSEMVLPSMSGHGQQMVLSGAGPVGPVWGISSTVPLDAPPATDVAAAAAPAVEVDAEAQTTSDDFAALDEALAGDTTTATPMPQSFDEFLANVEGVPAPAEPLQSGQEPLTPPIEQFTSTEDFAGVASVESAVIPAEAAPQPEASPAAESQPAAPQGSDPFWGMQRDMGSFIGGMPLPLGGGPNLPTGGGPAPQRPAAPAPRSRLPFADAPVTFDTKPEMLAEVVAVENESVPMFGAPGGSEPFRPMTSDLVQMDEPAEMNYGMPATPVQPAAPIDQTTAAAPLMPPADTSAEANLPELESFDLPEPAGGSADELTPIGEAEALAPAEPQAEPPALEDATLADEQQASPVQLHEGGNVESLPWNVDDLHDFQHAPAVDAAAPSLAEAPGEHSVLDLAAEHDELAAAHGELAAPASPADAAAESTIEEQPTDHDRTFLESGETPLETEPLPLEGEMVPPEPYTADVGEPVLDLPPVEPPQENPMLPELRAEPLGEAGPEQHGEAEAVPSEATQPATAQGDIDLDALFEETIDAADEPAPAGETEAPHAHAEPLTPEAVTPEPLTHEAAEPQAPAAAGDEIPAMAEAPAAGHHEQDTSWTTTLPEMPLPQESGETTLPQDIGLGTEPQVAEGGFEAPATEPPAAPEEVAPSIEDASATAEWPEAEPVVAEKGEWIDSEDFLTTPSAEQPAEPAATETPALFEETSAAPSAEAESTGGDAAVPSIEPVETVEMDFDFAPQSPEAIEPERAVEWIDESPAPATAPPAESAASSAPVAPADAGEPLDIFESASVHEEPAAASAEPSIDSEQSAAETESWQPSANVSEQSEWLDGSEPAALPEESSAVHEEFLPLDEEIAATDVPLPAESHAAAEPAEEKTDFAPQALSEQAEPSTADDPDSWALDALESPAATDVTPLEPMPATGETTETFEAPATVEPVEAETPEAPASETAGAETAAIEPPVVDEPHGGPATTFEQMFGSGTAESQPALHPELSAEPEIPEAEMPEAELLEPHTPEAEPEPLPAAPVSPAAASPAAASPAPSGISAAAIAGAAVVAGGAAAIAARSKPTTPPRPNLGRPAGGVPPAAAGGAFAGAADLGDDPAHADAFSGTSKVSPGAAPTGPSPAARKLIPPRTGGIRPPVGGAKASSAGAIRRPTGDAAAPLARKLDKPAAPRRALVARPGLATGAGFRPPTMPARGGAAAGNPPAARAIVPSRPANLAQVPAPGEPGILPAAPRDAFTNTGDAGVPALPPPSRKKRRLILIAVAVIITIAVIAFVFFKMKPTGTVRGSLHYEGLSRTQVAANERAEYQAQQKRLIQSPSIVQKARLELGNQRIDPGFVGDDAAVNQVLTNAKWDDQEMLVLSYPAVAEKSDAKRMHALLQVIARQHAAAQSYAAAESAADRPVADGELDRMTAELKKFKQELVLKQEQAAALPDRRAAAASLKQKRDEAFTTLEAARLRTASLRREVDRLELATRPSAPGNGAATQPADLVAADPEIQRMELQLKILTDSMAGMVKSKETQVSHAKAALDAAQREFDLQVAATKDLSKGDEALTRYVDGLTALAGKLRVLNDELAQQQKDDRDALEALRKQLSQAAADRLQKAWEADPDLKAMNEKRSLRERQYNAAASQRDPSADTLHAQLAAVELQIEERRRAMIAEDEKDPTNQRLSRFIDDRLAQMDQRRKRNEASVAQLLAEADKARPSIESLPAEQRARARKLEEARQSLADARDAYNNTLAPATGKSAEEVRELGNQIAAQQARVETRRKQVLEVKPDEMDTAAKLAEARTAYKIALSSEQNVQTLYDQRDDEYRRGQREADAAEAAQKMIGGYGREIVKLEQQITQRRVQVASEKRPPAEVVKLQPVQESSVSFIEEQDKRPVYGGVAFAGGVLLVLMAIVASRTPQETYIPQVFRDEERAEGLDDEPIEAENNESGDAPPLVRDPFSIPAETGRGNRALPI